MDLSQKDPARYDALLELRRKETEECQRQLGAYLQALQTLRDEASRHQKELDDLSADESSAGMRIDLAATAIRVARRDALKQELLRSELRQQHAQDEIDGQRSVLTEALRRERAVEKLRDRLHQAIAAEARRRERLELDELGNLSHGRLSSRED